MANLPLARSVPLAALDLGPLAWLLDDLRKSLAAASQAIRRFVADAKAVKVGKFTSLDASELHMAHGQFHQSAGALEMVGQQSLAKMLRALETLTQKFVKWPDACTADAAHQIEFASRALIHYLESTLKGAEVSPVSLFPQQRALLELAGIDRIHPADLWPHDWHWVEVPIAAPYSELRYVPAVRERLGDALLPIIKSLDRTQASEMAGVCLGLAAGESTLQACSFWAIAAGFFEAISLGTLPDDVYVRRTAARVIPQYGQMSAGRVQPSDRLAQDMLFYCAMAHPSGDTNASTLRAVRKAFGLNDHQKLNYELSPFGRFDPAQLTQARSRLGAAMETWAALVGGDLTRLNSVIGQFDAVGESLSKLHTENTALVASLSAAAVSTVRTGAAPTPAIAMEVATSILYLEAVYEDLDLTSDTMAQRGNRLAARLQHVCTGGFPQPIELWMEQLYRRVSDRQTMGTVTVELRGALAEVEKSFDRYLRNTGDSLALQSVPVHLGQMRGVFSVLGLDQAALATLRIRAVVERLLTPGTPPGKKPEALSQKEINSLSALGFLIDMLSYQPAMAKEIFFYDEDQGEFRLRMHRAGIAEQVLTKDDLSEVEPGTMSAPSSLSGLLLPEGEPDRMPGHPRSAGARGGNASPSDVDEDEGLQAIFLKEAGLVVLSGLEAVDALAASHDNFSAQASLRRAFHTLKGSSRMVGKSEMGDAAWAFEQLLNTGLEHQTPVDDRAVQLCGDALRAMGAWIKALAEGGPLPTDIEEIRRSADNLRLHDRYSPPSGPRESASSSGIANAGASIDGAIAVEAELASIGQSAGQQGRSGSDHQTSLYVSAMASPVAADGQRPLVVVGSLQLSAAFFDVFLQEATQWAQSLVSEILLWEPDTEKSPPANARALAHALQGGSSAVGFTELSNLSRGLEEALGHLALSANASHIEKKILSDAAHDISRLVAAFAVRTMADADPLVVHGLNSLLNAALTQAVRPLAEQNNSETELQLLMDASNFVQGDAEFAMLFNQEGENKPLVVSLEVGADVVAPEPLAPPLTVPMQMQMQRRTSAPELTPALLMPDQELESEDLLDAELLPVFLEEGRELVPALNEALQQWVLQPEQVQFRGESLRLLHTVKGSARLAGALKLGELAHRLESTLEKLGMGPLQANQMEPCLSQLDQLNTLFDALEGWNAPTGADSSVQMSSTFVPQFVLSLPGSSGAVVPLNSKLGARGLARQSVRVRSQILDRLIDQSGEVMVSRSRVDGHVAQMRSALGEFSRNLDRLRRQLRELELQADLQMQSRLTESQAAPSFDPLEFDRFTRVQEVSRMMAESVSDIETVHRSLQSSVDGAQEDLVSQSRRARELQNDLLRMRLIEFEGISERLYAVVRQASKEMEKPVRLDIVGGSIEIDRGMLDRMTPAFEHLLRNAVAHGIEPVSDRLAKGKPATGAISILLAQDGSDVSVTFSDDGGGLQIEKIRARAIASNLLGPDQPLEQEEAARLLFIPGFSTAETVTELAGRGIGMDVVLSDVSAVGGRVECISQSGGGTSFKVVFPLTTAVTQVVMVRLGALTIGVPANMLETVLRLPSDALAAAYADGSLVYADRPAIPFFWAGTLLNASTRSHELPARQHAVTVIRSAGQRVALHVDEVLGSREMVVKNLGPQLSGLPGLTGMSVMASGAVVLIYNPLALASLYGEQARSMQARDAAQTSGSLGTGVAQSWSCAVQDAGPEEAPLVLVVDDSITVRRVTQRLLKREGFRVALAVDGLQALQLLKDERPVLVLSDIEMPGMDGFDLARNIRRDSSKLDLPIIVITSRIAQKHRDHALALGVNHYLGKPYSETELIGLIRNYCPKPALV